MRITRNLLLGITAGLGVFIIVYSLIRQFTGISFDESLEKYILDGVIFAALGIFIYNRKLGSDEKKAREAKEQAEKDGETGEE